MSGEETPPVETDQERESLVSIEIGDRRKHAFRQATPGEVKKKS